MGPLHWWRNFRTRRLNSGAYWERQAELYLQSQGMKTLHKNYQTSAGEVDLVMMVGEDTVVFVEVRYRFHQAWANALESVTPQKQKKIIKAASQLMSKKQWHNRYHARFDVVAIQGDPKEPTIEWIEHAFY